MRGRDFDGEPHIVIEQRDAGIGTLLLGLVLGAGAALLFAPRSGPETRRMLGSRAREMRDTALSMVDDMAGSLQNSFEDVRDQVATRTNDVRTAARRGQRQVRDAFDAGRSAAHQARIELERKIAEQKATPRDGMARSETMRHDHSDGEGA